jgi:hypothetical protein
MNLPKQLTRVCAALAATAAMPATADVVFDNLLNPLGQYLGGFAYEEVADEAVLGPGSRVFSSISVAYAGFNFDGDEKLTVTLYKLDGPPTLGSFGLNTPGTVLFTDTADIAETAGDVIIFSDSSGAIILPDTVVVGISLSGVDFDPTGQGSDGGPLLYDPINVGSGFTDYWVRGYPNLWESWSLYTFFGNPPVNFGVQIVTGVPIPEPATWLGMLGLATVVGATALRRARRRA